MGGRLYTYGYTVTTRMTPALRWAAMRAIFMFNNCEGQSHKTVSTDHSGGVYVHASQVRFTVGDSGLCCCVCLCDVFRALINSLVYRVSNFASS